MTPNAESVCRNRPGRGHEWYTSPTGPFCRDCGYGTAQDADYVPLSVSCRWRVGRKVGRTIYTIDNEQTGDGRLIGVMDTRALAKEAVDAHNAGLDRNGR